METATMPDLTNGESNTISPTSYNQKVPPRLGTIVQVSASSYSIVNGTSSPSSVLHAKLTTTPPEIIKAQGNYLITSDGTEIFDATGGAAVACIGHGHPAVKAAILKQLDEVEYCYSPFFTTSASEVLAEQLKESTGSEMSKVFIVSSGTEAVEAALKMARQYFVEIGEPERAHFIARKQSYHGNTLGALSVGHHKARRGIYEPLLPTNVSHISPCYPYRRKRPGQSDEEYIQSLAAELEAEFQRIGPGRICALILETLPGLTLGAVPPPKGYIAAMQRICHAHGALLILDEVMCGMGRTGTFHAWEQEGVVPDLQTVAKGLGAGYQPIGALLVSRKVVEGIEKGTGSFVHSQTYQGHAVACAAARAVQEVVREEGMVENVRDLGVVLGDKLGKRLGGHGNVGDIRGRGFMWGIELVQHKPTKEPFPASKKISAAIHATGLQKEHGISILPGGGVKDGVNGDVVMLAPAYNCTREDIDLIVERTAKVIEAVLGS